MDSISASLPVAPSRTERRKSALVFGGRAGALTPETVAPGRALRLPWLLHRLRLLRARATAGSCCWGQAVHRARLTRPQRPRRDDERLLGARQRRGTASPSSWTRPERLQLVLRRVHGCCPPACKRRKRRATAEGQNIPERHATAESPARPHSYLVRTTVTPLEQRSAVRCWAALGLPRRAPQTALLRPEAAAWPPLACQPVEIASIAMDEGLVVHGAACGPASVARKRSGRAMARARPRQQHLEARERFCWGVRQKRIPNLKGQGSSTAHRRSLLSIAGY